MCENKQCSFLKNQEVFSLLLKIFFLKNFTYFFVLIMDLLFLYMKYMRIFAKYLQDMRKTKIWAKVMIGFVSFLYANAIKKP